MATPPQSSTSALKVGFAAHSFGLPGRAGLIRLPQPSLSAPSSVSLRENSPNEIKLHW